MLNKLEKDIRQFQDRAAPASASQRSDARMLARMSAGFGSGVLAGTLMGVMLDRWLGTAPVLLLLGLALGTAVGGMTVYRAAQAMEEDDGNTEGTDTENE